MNVYSTDKIRNVVLLGHGGAGKTTIVEAMAFLAGLTKRMGKVADGNTLADYDKEEIKRGYSISASVIPLEWEGTKINILDTPGLFDFSGEAEEAASAADAAIIIINGKAGVEVGTQKAWDLCEKYNLPRMIIVSNMDDNNANFNKALGDLKELYGTKIAPFSLPIHEDNEFKGYVNLTSGQAYVYKDKAPEKADIPENLKADAETYHGQLVEAVAETTDELMEKYFDGQEFTADEIRQGLSTGVAAGDVVPVAPASGIEARGVFTLLSDIVKYLPSPAGSKASAKNGKTGEDIEIECSDSGSKVMYVFKTIVDPFIGKYSLVKVISGVIKPDEMLYNEEHDIDEKIGKLYILTGNKATEVPELHAGDIGALAKMGKLVTGDTLSPKAAPVVVEKTVLPVPYTAKAYRSVKKGEEDKINQSLQKIMQEDKTLKIVNDGSLHQTLLYAMGDQQIDITVSKLKNIYKVDVELYEPRIPYRETIKKKSDVEAKHKKQTGGHGQYGHVKMRFEPSGDLDKPYEFATEVVGGTVPKNFFPAVEKGIQESVERGPLAGYPVVGLKTVLYDGSYHPVDSSEMAFKTAASMAFKKGMMEAEPVLLEPIVSLKVVVPDKYTGDIMGDLPKRRGRVLGTNPVGGGKTEIMADVPMAGVSSYNTDLRSMTGGAGTYSYEFARYEQAPSDVQAAEVAARAAEDEE